MAILRAKEVSYMSKEELEKKLEELKMELLKLSAQRATKSSSPASGKIKELRRTIAKILTKLKS